MNSRKTLVYGLTAVATFVLLGYEKPARAWGDLGHETVAEIAERNLSPKAKSLVFSIIGIEPLAVSATFPDHVRDDDRFKSFSPYHFMEIPFDIDANKIAPNQRPKKDADVIISQVPDLLTSPTVSREKKMVLLRYLIHVVGDVHQPLHVGNGVDMGANLCSVTWKDAASSKTFPENLHSVWDEKLFDYAREDFMKAAPTTGKKPWFGYKAMADIVTKIQMKAPLAPSKPADWYAEASRLHPQVYPDATPVSNPKDRPYCKTIDPVTKKTVTGAFDASKIPLLDEAYARKSLEIAKLQILKGGLRLAQTLNDAAERTPGLANQNPADLDGILKDIQIENSEGHE